MLIDQLPTLSSTTDTDEIPIERGTTTYKTTLQKLLESAAKKVGDIFTGNVRLKGATFPDSSSATPSVSFVDSVENSWGAVSAYRNTGNTRGGMLMTGGYRGYSTANQLGLLSETDGTAYVFLSNPTAWRTALSLGTNGALPLTIAQGGTGMTARSYTAVVDNIITSTGSGFTVTQAEISTWGKVASVRVKFKHNTAVNITNLTVCCTLVSSYKPVVITSVTSTSPTSIISSAYLNTSGAFYITGNLAANTEYSIMATYILY